MVQPMYMVSKPASRGLSPQVVGCLFIKLRTYFQRTVREECSLSIKFLNLPSGNCLPGCSLYFLVPTYIQGTVSRECSLFFVPNLHQGDCPLGCIQGCVFAMFQSFFFSILSMRFPRLTDNQKKNVRISLSISLFLSVSLFLTLILSVCLSLSLSLFLSLSLSLSLVEHNAYGQAQTRSLSTSRPKFNRANMKID